MCRGDISENTLVEVPPDYEADQDDEVDDNDQMCYSSTKVCTYVSSFLIDRHNYRII